MKLLVNNIEQVQPQDRDDTIFHLHCRDVDGEYWKVRVFGFRPYFYAPRHNVEISEDWFLSQDSIEEIEYGDFTAFGSGVELAKIYTPYPQDTREARSIVDGHHSADVPFTRRLRIDTGIRDVIEVPGENATDGTIDAHWREISPVVPPSAGSNPGGNTDKEVG